MFSGVGCTDQNASNYNSNAFIDDNSCLFNDCEENMYQLQIETYTGNWAEEMSWAMYDVNTWESQGSPLTSFTGNINQQTIINDREAPQ